MKIRIVLPYLPPSSNAAYANIRGTNKRMLSTEGKAFKTETAVLLAQRYGMMLKELKPNEPYVLAVRFFMPDMFNKGWPTKAATKFKKQDVSNRVKLLEDVLKDVAGIDDSQNVAIYADKVPADTPSTCIVILSGYQETLEVEQLFKSNV